MKAGFLSWFRCFCLIFLTFTYVVCKVLNLPKHKVVEAQSIRSKGKAGPGSGSTSSLRTGISGQATFIVCAQSSHVRVGTPSSRVLERRRSRERGEEIPRAESVVLPAPRSVRPAVRRQPYRVQPGAHGRATARGHAERCSRVREHECWPGRYRSGDGAAVLVVAGRASLRYSATLQVALNIRVISPALECRAGQLPDDTF